MGQTSPDDIISRVVSTTPDLKLENPPEALFAKGNEQEVDLRGELSMLALLSPSQLVSFDSVEVRQSVGMFDQSSEVRDQDQIEDIRFVKEEMQTEDPGKLKQRVMNIISYALKKKLLLHGILELEANAFGTSIFVNVKPEFINKLEAMHKHFRATNTFPQIEVFEEKEGFFKQQKKKVAKIRFVGMARIIGRIWPKYENEAFEIDLREKPSSVSGLVVLDIASKAAEFIIISENVTADGDLDWLVIKPLLEDFKFNRKTPVCWFRWQLGLTGLYHLYGFEAVREDPEIKTLISTYNLKVQDFKTRYYKDDTIMDAEKQVRLDRLRGDEREAVIEDLKEAMSILDKWYDETPENNG